MDPLLMLLIELDPGTSRDPGAHEPSRGTDSAELIVLEICRQGIISSGKAAELLGMSGTALIEHASKLGIPYFDTTRDEFEEELAPLRKV